MDKCDHTPRSEQEPSQRKCSEIRKLSEQEPSQGNVPSSSEHFEKPCFDHPKDSPLLSWQDRQALGIDACVVNGPDDTLSIKSRLKAKASGRSERVWGDTPLFSAITQGLHSYLAVNACQSQSAADERHDIENTYDFYINQLESIVAQLRAEKSARLENM